MSLNHASSFGYSVIIAFPRFPSGNFVRLSAYFLKKGFGKIAIAISLFLALIIGLNSILVGYLSDISAQLPSDFVQGVQLILPSNALPCFYVILSVKAAIFIFDVKQKIVSYLDWDK